MQKRLVVLSLSLFVAGCSGSNSSAPLISAVGESPVAETVNGTPVPQVLVDAFAKARGADLDKPEQRAQVLRVFADYVLLAEQARRDGFASKPGFAAEVETARLSALANATMREMQEQTPIGDDMLKAEYDAGVARSGKVEYDFSQLLFADEADALKASGDIVAGKPFAQVYDAWKEKAKQAKVFTHVHPDQMPGTLVTALGELKSGESSKLPVKTQFGWHVIHLDATSPYTPPSFDQVKEGLRRQLAARAAQQRLDQLREQAKIEYPQGVAPPAKPGAPAAASAARPEKKN